MDGRDVQTLVMEHRYVPLQYMKTQHKTSIQAAQIGLDQGKNRLEVGEEERLGGYDQICCEKFSKN